MRGGRECGRIGEKKAASLAEAVAPGGEINILQRVCLPCLPRVHRRSRSCSAARGPCCCTSLTSDPRVSGCEVRLGYLALDIHHGRIFYGRGIPRDQAHVRLFFTARLCILQRDHDPAVELRPVQSCPLLRMPFSTQPLGPLFRPKMAPPASLLTRRASSAQPDVRVSGEQDGGTDHQREPFGKGHGSGRAPDTGKGAHPVAGGRERESGAAKAQAPKQRGERRDSQDYTRRMNDRYCSFFFGIPLCRARSKRVFYFFVRLLPRQALNAENQWPGLIGGPRE